MKILSLTILFFTALTITAQTSAIPELRLNDISNGDEVEPEQLKDAEQLLFYNNDGSVNTTFAILGGVIIVSGVPGAGLIKQNGILDRKSLSLLKESSGKRVAMEIDYLDDKGAKRKGFLKFRVQY